MRALSLLLLLTSCGGKESPDDPRAKAVALCKRECAAMLRTDEAIDGCVIGCIAKVEEMRVAAEGSASAHAGADRPTAASNGDLAALTGIKERMCACGNAACAKKVLALTTAAVEAMTPPSDPEMALEFDSLRAQIAACHNAAVAK